MPAPSASGTLSQSSSTQSAWGPGWQFKPQFLAREIYSDNIGLASHSADSRAAFVTELSPGLRIHRDGSRNKFDLNYRLQSFFYAGIDRGAQLRNRLQMNSTTELVDDEIFLDSRSTIGQANTNAVGRLVTDNSSATNTQSEYKSFRLSPYWRPHLGGYVEGEIRFAYGYVGSGNTSSLSNAHLIQESVNLENGHKDMPFGWRANFNNYDIQREQSAGIRGSNDILFRNYNGELSYGLTKEYFVLAQAGVYDNDFGSSSGARQSRNGAYFTPGLAWIPSPRFSLAGGYGINNRFATLRWSPTPRTGLQVYYRNSDVGGATSTGFGTGLNNGVAGFGQTLSSTQDASTGQGYNLWSSPFGPLGGGNVGSTWNGSLFHRTRMTFWNATYLVSTTTVQQLLSEQQVFDRLVDVQGNLGDPEANPVPIDLPSFSDAIITRKRGQVSVTGFTAKNTVRLSAYHENRRYEGDISSSDRDVYGFMASWNWRIGSRTSSTVRGAWQEIQSQGNRSNQSELYYVSWILNRRVTEFLDGAVELRHQQLDANDRRSDYTENRVSASVNVHY